MEQGLVSTDSEEDGKLRSAVLSERPLSPNTANREHGVDNKNPDPEVDHSRASTDAIANDNADPDRVEADPRHSENKNDSTLNESDHREGNNGEVIKENSLSPKPSSAVDDSPAEATDYDHSNATPKQYTPKTNPSKDIGESEKDKYISNGSVPNAKRTIDNAAEERSDTPDSTSSLTKITGQRNTAIVDESRRQRSASIEDSDEDYRMKVTHCRCMPKRYMLAILSFFGFFNVYCLRVDLSVALVAMTNNHTRVRYDGSEYWVPAEFDWSPQIQGHILGAFYYGYLLTQIPGGYIAARFGGKSLFGIAIMLAAVMTLLTPVASRRHWAWLFLLRSLEGVCEGCIYPAMYAIWSRWAPPNERARLATIPHSGSYAGSVVGTLVAGYLCELCGWAWVFYLFGLFALMWVAMWFILISDSPDTDRHISEFEKNYILDSLKDDQTSKLVKGSPPWKSIFTSLPFLAIFVAHTCEGWGFNTLQTSLPKFLSEGLNMRIFHSGAYTATMYMIMGVVVLVAGQLSDFTRIKFNLTTTAVRKAFTAIGFIPNGIALIISVHLNSAKAAMVVLAIGTGVESISWSGFAINHLDIAPRYASLLFGITNTAATIPGVLSPLLVGAITGAGNRQEWTAVFYISAITFFIGAAFFVMFASAERQPWGTVSDVADVEENESSEKNNKAKSKKDTYDPSMKDRALDKNR